MIDWKNKKIIGIIAMLVIVLIMSFLTYGKNKSNVFKDEYMKEIFVEESIDEEVVSNVQNEDIVIQEQINKVIVEIKGEVKNPDVYELEEGSIIKDLIDIAGGLTDEADISKVNRARQLNNHELVVIRNKNDIYDEEVLEETTCSNEEISDGLININTADVSELKTIPGIGDVKANAIIAYRESNGEFKSLDELKNVDGIGEKTYEKIKNMMKL